MNKFNMIIDTLEIKTSINNINYNKINDNDNNIIIKKTRMNKDSEISVPCSINRGVGHYARIEGFKEFKERFDNFMYDDLEIIKMDKVELNRLDIAIDSMMDFKESYKYLLYIHSLIMHSDKYSSSWTTISHEDYKANTIHAKSSNLDVVFYNKHAESKGKAPYNTRMEFRAKNIVSMDFVKHINRVKYRVEEMYINISMLDKSTTTTLCKLYNDEMAKANTLSFAEFVRKYNYLIFTKNILENLYIHAEMKGNLTHWIKKFRIKTKLELFTNKDIENYQKECLRAIKKYGNN